MSSESPTEQSNERKRFSPKKMVALTAAIAVLATAGCGKEASKNAQPKPTATKTELPAASQSPATSPEATTAPISSEIVANMEQYKAMDIDTFNLLPQDVRLQFSQYLIEQTVRLGNYDATYGEGAYDHAKMVKPVTVSTDNTGQEIIDSNLYNYQVANLIFGGNSLCVDAGEKALSSTYDQVDSDQLVSGNFTTDMGEMTTRLRPLGVKDIDKAIKTSTLMTGIDRNGVKVQYKTVEFTDSADTEPVYERFIYREFTNDKGQKQAVWLEDIYSFSSNSLANESTVLQNP